MDDYIQNNIILTWCGRGGPVGLCKLLDFLFVLSSRCQMSARSLTVLKREFSPILRWILQLRESQHCDISLWKSYGSAADTGKSIELSKQIWIQWGGVVPSSIPKTSSCGPENLSKATGVMTILVLLKNYFAMHKVLKNVQKNSNMVGND